MVVVARGRLRQDIEHAYDNVFNVHIPAVVEVVAGFEAAFFAGAFLLGVSVTAVVARRERPAAAVVGISFPFAVVTVAGGSAGAAAALAGVFAFAFPFFGGIVSCDGLSVELREKLMKTKQLEQVWKFWEVMSKARVDALAFRDRQT